VFVFVEEKRTRILACHQLFQRLVSPKESMPQQQRLDTIVRPTAIQPKYMNTKHCQKVFKDDSEPIYKNKGRKGMEIYPISTEKAKSRSLGTK